MTRVILAFLLILVVATDVNPVELTVNPRVLLVGGSVRVACRIEPHPANRQVAWGFTFYLNEERSLEGESSRITWEARFDHVPCDPGEAFCALVRTSGMTIVRTLPIEVGGCHVD